MNEAGCAFMYKEENERSRKTVDLLFISLFERAPVAKETLVRRHLCLCVWEVWTVK